MSWRMPQRRKPPCTGNCPDRCAEPNCHGYCEKYLQYKADVEEERNRILEQRKNEGEAKLFLMSQCRKEKAKKNGKR